MSVTNYGETALLDVFFNGTNNAKAARYVQLHVGDPGETGASNVATETTRKSVTSAAASSGTFTSTNDLIWTNVAGTETYTHISIWDASTVGNALWYGALTASKAVVAGDTFTIATGSLTVSLD